MRGYYVLDDVGLCGDSSSMNDEIYNGQFWKRIPRVFDPEETAAFVTSAVVLLPVFASASMPIGRSDVDLAQLQLEFDHSSTSISHTNTQHTYTHIDRYSKTYTSSYYNHAPHCSQPSEIRFQAAPPAEKGFRRTLTPYPASRFRVDCC
jgi:hypothetical protein